MKGCILLYGECFRLGGQENRNRDTDESYNEQIKAAISHINLIEEFQKKQVEIDVYISSYKTKFENDLLDIYKGYNKGCNFYENLMGQNSLISLGIEKIENKHEYEFILIMRIDLFLKDKFIEIFNPKWDKILWPSICFKPHHIICGAPRVNDMMVFILCKYFPYFKKICNTYSHDSWYYLIKDTDLKYEDLDTMVKTFHDSDSAKDFNPLYYVVNRQECKIQHTVGEYFDKYNL
jgi:hypothetical protein